MREVTYHLQWGRSDVSGGKVTSLGRSENPSAGQGASQAGDRADETQPRDSASVVTTAS